MKLKTLTLGLLTILGVCSTMFAQLTHNPLTNLSNTGLPVTMQTRQSLPRRNLSISAALPPAVVGASYSGAFTVSGGTAPFRFTISSGQLPAGLALNGTTGALSGKPSEAGTFSFAISAADVNSRVGTHSFQMTVLPAPSVVVTVTPATATVGSAGTVQFGTLVSNTSNVAVTWSASLGTISQTGLYQAPTVSSNTTATVTATSAADPTKSGTASVTIMPPPLSLTTTSVSSATAGTLYSSSLSASGGTAPLTWTLASGALPSGIVLQPSGSLSGTTSQPGQFNFTLQVADSSSPKQTASEALTLTVIPPPLSLTTTSLLGATAGAPYSDSLVASGGTAPLTWTLASGTLPAGIVLQSSGLLSGTTSQSGQFNFTMQVADSSSPKQIASRSVTLTVTPPPLSLTTTALSSATAGVAYSTSFSATGGSAPYTFTLTSGKLPAGIALQSTGSLSGTTSQSGQFNFTVQVADSSSPKQTASSPLTLAVNGPLPSPAFFGFSENATATGNFPTVSYGMQRFWDSPPLQWPSLNPASGVFDFSGLDTALAQGFSNGVTEGMYTLARTPPWATSNPADTSCHYATAALGGGPGECDAPVDLNPDGSGANAIWKAWITAIASHANDPTYLQSHSHIKYWEVWNEPDTEAFWAGSIAQLARLTEDAKCIITGRGVIHENGNGTATPCAATAIDPTAQIVMASGHAKTVALTFAQNQLYCTANPTGSELPCPNPPNAIAAAVDIINFHMKPGSETGNTCPVPTPCTPESAMQMYVNNIHGMLQPAELAKPLWDGEASYSTSGFSGAYTDPDMAASFMARFYVIDWSLGISGTAWYTWDQLKAEPAQVQTAYQQTYNWLSTSSLSTPCAATGTVWSCGIIQSGTPHQIMWDTAQSCSNGSCTTANQTVAPEFTQYQDMTTASTPITISGHVVPVGIKPVVLQ
jgi:hypothetical protein